MKQKLVSIEIGCNIKQVEDEFSKKKVYSPIIKFVKYMPKSQMDVYLDEKTGKQVKVSCVRRVVKECTVCKKRNDRYRALKRDVLSNKEKLSDMEKWYKVRDEYVVKRECPECGNRLSSSMADHDFKTHTHSCNRCDEQFPESLEEVYKGDYSDDSLNYPHGEF